MTVESSIPPFPCGPAHPIHAHEVGSSRGDPLKDIVLPLAKKISIILYLRGYIEIIKHIFEGAVTDVRTAYGGRDEFLVTIGLH